VCLSDTVYVLYVFVQLLTMEKLSAAQQQGVKKMSDERLRLKLVAAGYEEDVVMDIYIPISKTATNSQRKRTVNNRQIISYSLHHFPVP